MTEVNIGPIVERICANIRNNIIDDDGKCTLTKATTELADMLNTYIKDNNLDDTVSIQILGHVMTKMLYDNDINYIFKDEV